MTRTSVLVAIVGLLLLVPQAGAATLLDTLTVDPGATEAVTGKTTLKPGTRYSMEVSGTYQVVGPEGFGTKYDGLYCFGGVGFDPSVPPQCPHSGTSDTSSHFSEIKVGIGASKMFPPDQYGTPGSAGSDTTTQVPYRADHSYAFPFFAPESGTLRAGGWKTYNDCTGCKSTYSGGPIVIKLFGPSSDGEAITGIPVSDGGPVTCVAARRSLAHADEKTAFCPLGQVAVKAAPASGTPVDTSSARLKGNTKSITGYAAIDKAGGAAKAAVAIVDNSLANDVFDGCLVFGGVDPDVVAAAFVVGALDDREEAVIHLCAAIAGQALAKSSSPPQPRAHAAAGTCHAAWVPLFKRGTKVTKRKYRRAIAAHNRMQKERCRVGANGQMTFSVVARHGSLNRALGRRAQAAYMRVTSVPDGAGARLRYSFKTT